MRPLAIHEWNHLRVQDFKIIAEYNSALFSIVSKLKICNLENMVTEDNLIDKTLSTFHAENSNTYLNNTETDNLITYNELLASLLEISTWTKSHRIL